MQRRTKKTRPATPAEVSQALADLTKLQATLTAVAEERKKLDAREAGLRAQRTRLARIVDRERVEVSNT